MIALLFKIGFLEIRFLDLLDILLVALLLFNLYKLLKGSLAFNIFFGLLLVYLAWLFVRALNMELLEGILGQFIDVGVIALLIVFQPEVRRFLLYIGKSSLFRSDTAWRRFFNSKWEFTPATQDYLDEIMIALQHLATHATGALLVFPKTSQLQFFANTGERLDALVSSKLLISIFEKNSPLHDGAVIIVNGKVMAAKCILPVSENPDLPKHIGTRHRASVGITEHSDATAVVVSEERGQLAYARGGQIKLNVSEATIRNVLKAALFDE